MATSEDFTEVETRARMNMSVDSWSRNALSVVCDQLGTHEEEVMGREGQRCINKSDAMCEFALDCTVT